MKTSLGNEINNNGHNIYILAKDRNFIANERQTMFALVNALIFNTILILISVCALILPLGLSATLMISLGSIGIIIGSVCIGYCLKLLYSQSAVWRNHYLEVRKLLQSNSHTRHLFLPDEKNRSKFLSVLYPSPLDIFSYNGSMHCMGRSRTVIAMSEIVLGISSVISSAVAGILLPSGLSLGIGLLLGIVGAFVFVLGVESINKFSIASQGVIHFYLAKYESQKREEEKQELQMLLAQLTLKLHSLESEIEKYKKMTPLPVKEEISSQEVLLQEKEDKAEGRISSLTRSASQAILNSSRSLYGYFSSFVTTEVRNMEQEAASGLNEVREELQQENNEIDEYIDAIEDFD